MEEEQGKVRPQGMEPGKSRPKPYFAERYKKKKTKQATTQRYGKKVHSIWVPINRVKS